MTCCRAIASLAMCKPKCFGITANAHDMAEVTEGDRGRVNALVLLAIFTILLVLVRNVVLAAYLLVTVLASYFAALGATVLVASVWLGQPIGGLDWRRAVFPVHDPGSRGRRLQHLAH